MPNSGVEISLAGRKVLVTGGSSGIGRAIAIACAESGADVAFTYHVNRAGAESAAAGIRATGREPAVLRADLSKPADIEALARSANAALGRVDVWINNAGADILTGAGAGLSAREKLDLLLNVDLRGTVLASWAAVDLMQKQTGGGLILNMAWDHVVGGATRGEYAPIFCAAKGGIYSFSKALARAVAPLVRVNVIGPGWVETAWGAELDPEVKARITDAIPLKRWGTPEDVASAAVFLASDAASYISGHMLMINGGDVI